MYTSFGNTLTGVKASLHGDDNVTNPVDSSQVHHAVWVVLYFCTSTAIGDIRVFVTIHRQICAGLEYGMGAALVGSLAQCQVTSIAWNTIAKDHGKHGLVFMKILIQYFLSESDRSNDIWIYVWRVREECIDPSGKLFMRSQENYFCASFPELSRSLVVSQLAK